MKKVFYCILLVVLLSGCIDKAMEKISKRNKAKYIEEVYARMPLYLKISEGELLPKDGESRLIKTVYYNAPNGNITYGEVVEKSFPTIPREFRRWECYKYKGNIYVCYVVKSYFVPGLITAFIWRIDDGCEHEYEVIPVNEPANMALIACYGSRGIDNYRLLHKLPDRERQIVEFYSDRLEFCRYHQDRYDYFEKKTIKRFGISKDEFHRIIMKYPYWWDNR